MGKSLFYGSDTAWIFTADDIFDFPGQGKLLFFHNLSVFDDIDRNGVVDKAENVQIQHVHVTFHFQDIFPVHLAAAGIFDNCHGTVQLVKL